MRQSRFSAVHDINAYVGNDAEIRPVEGIAVTLANISDSRTNLAALDLFCAEVHFLKSIRVGQGSEFISRDFNLRACLCEVTLDFARPDKPMDDTVTAPQWPTEVEAPDGTPIGFLPLPVAARFGDLARVLQRQSPCSAIGDKVPAPLTELEGTADLPKTLVHLQL